MSGCHLPLGLLSPLTFPEDDDLDILTGGDLASRCCLGTEGLSLFSLLSVGEFPKESDEASSGNLDRDPKMSVSGNRDLDPTGSLSDLDIWLSWIDRDSWDIRFC